MKIALPTDGENLDDLVTFHFGQAKNYLIYNTDTKDFNVFPNPEIAGRKELPPEFLNKLDVSAVICFDLGQRAFEKFKDFGIKIYEALEKNIAENVKSFQEEKLKKL